MSYGGPITLGEGSHNVDLRAVDVAGNTATESLSIDVDSVSPFVDLDAVPSFCPGCGETLGILVIVQDSGSGIADWDLTADGVGVAGGGSTTNQTITWDGSGLGGRPARHRPGGPRRGREPVGRQLHRQPGAADPHPDRGADQDSRADRHPGAAVALRPVLRARLPSATPQGPSAATPTRLPTATRTPLTILFGAPPPAPATPPGADHPPIRSPAPRLRVRSWRCPPVWSTEARRWRWVLPRRPMPLDQARKRKEEEARQREEMRRLNAQAEAREEAERARLGALYAAAAAAGAEVMRRDAERRGLEDGAGAASPPKLFAPAPGGRRDDDEPSKPGSLEWKERMLEPALPPEPPPFDLARWKQEDYAAGKGWERERAARIHREGEEQGEHRDGFAFDLSGLRQGVSLADKIADPHSSWEASPNFRGIWNSPSFGPRDARGAVGIWEYVNWVGIASWSLLVQSPVTCAVRG